MKELTEILIKTIILLFLVPTLFFIISIILSFIFFRNDENNTYMLMGWCISLGLFCSIYLVKFNFINKMFIKYSRQL